MQPSRPSSDATQNAPKLVAAWVFVSVPFLWGIYVTIGNVSALFK